MHPETRSSFIDLTHPLVEPMSCYPGDPRFKTHLACSFPLTSSKPESQAPNTPDMVVTVHSLSLGTHTGTHIDAPFHFFPSGKKLHEIELERFVGRVVVLDVRHFAKERARIDWEDLINATGACMATTTTASGLSQIGSRAEGKADIVLLWTGWDTHWSTPKYLAHPYFSREVAEKLRDLGARIVGVDALNPDETPVDENTETKDGWGVHEELLGHEVLICENLRGVGDLVDGGGRESEEIWVSLMPLSIHGADGAPVRAYGWRKYPIAH
ncbi:putative cyclase [Gyrodon lividus]|nr:putative cyclase [Gyrodon lividus]